MWRYAFARATGVSHLRTGAPCQDYLACTTTGDWLVAVVADGAGSAAKAERGAQVAVETIIHELRGVLADQPQDVVNALRQAAIQARQAVLAEADLLGCNPKELACTLLIAVGGANGGGALQIGDGVIVVRGDDQDWGWVFWPQRGEYANTTRFLTDDDALEMLEIDSLPCDITDIALMSDGVESLALDYTNGTAHQPFFHAMIRPLASACEDGELVRLSDALCRFLSSEQIASRTADDVFLILATRADRSLPA